MFVQQIQEDIKESLKKNQALRLGTLRMLSSALHNRQIEKRSRGAGELSEEETIGVLRSEVKKRREAIREFTKGGRQDLADRETEELAILQIYLPPELSDEEVERMVGEVMASAGALGPKDFGRIMGLVMIRVGTAASGERVAEILHSILHDRAA